MSNSKTLQNLTNGKNDSEVINWFINQKQKHSKNFVQWDIDSFYPSINEDLLQEALDWAETLVDISENDKKLIFQTKKSLLFNEGQPWIKKGDKHFDNTMGSFDGAEICELIGLFLLHKLNRNGVKDVGLY